MQGNIISTNIFHMDSGMESIWSTLRFLCGFIPEDYGISYEKFVWMLTLSIKEEKKKSNKPLSPNGVSIPTSNTPPDTGIAPEFGGDYFLVE
jgi:hypothetical protein